MIYTTLLAVAFVTIMITSPMTLRTVAGQNYADHLSGQNICLELWSNTDTGLPSFMECLHTDLYAADDMMVGLGLYTFYDGDSDFYNYGNWWFSQQSGWDGSATVSFMPPMGMYFDLAYGQSEATRLIYYNYNSGDWLTFYWYYVLNGWHKMYFDQQYQTAQVYYLGEQWNWNFNDYNSAEGMTQGAFYYNNNPYTVYYHYAQTQVPPGVYIPSGILSYDFLTAHTYYEYPGYWGNWP